MLESYFAFEELLADILRESIELSGLKVKAPELARVIVFGMKGFKDVAKDGKEMRRMIAALIEMVTAALKSGDTRVEKNDQHC